MPKVKERTVKIGGIDLIITETEYETFRRRNKVIFWLGEGRCVELGRFTTILYSKQEKPPFSKVYYEPLYFEVELTYLADHSEVSPFFFLDEEIAESNGLFNFDDKEDADKFIDGLKVKGIEYGGVEIDSRAEFKRWKKLLDIVSRDSGETQTQEIDK